MSDNNEQQINDVQENSIPEEIQENPEKKPFRFTELILSNYFIVGVIVFSVLALVIFILMNAIFNSGNSAGEISEQPQVKGVTNSTSFADDIIGDNRDKSGLTLPVIPANKGISGEENRTESGAGVPELTDVTHPAEDGRYAEIQPKLELATPPTADDVDLQLKQQDIAQIRQIKIEGFRAAVTGKTTAQFSPQRTERNTSISSAEEQLSADRQRLNQMKRAGADELFNQRIAELSSMGVNVGSAGMPDMAEGFTGTNSGARGNNRTMTDFEARTPDPSRWILQSKVLRPAQYSLLTGTVIPATLITGINSDIPGQVTAQVSQNVYDTARGKYLLIPQGSRLIGGYSANVIYGQERLLLGWQRLIFPDGRSIDIGSMPGTDQSGYSGVNDEVNNHYLRLFGSAMMLSVISAGSAWAADRTSNDNDSKSFSNEFASSAGSQMSQTSSELIRKNMNIAPTLTVRPGFRINVMVTKDITVTGVYKDYVY